MEERSSNAFLFFVYIHCRNVRILMKPTEYEIVEPHSDIVSEPSYDLFYNNGENERIEEGTLRVLSIFSDAAAWILDLKAVLFATRNPL